MSGLDNEAGGHRIQRIPPTERKGRVHTSTVTVAVLKEAKPQAVEDQFKVDWYSGSGAGGQHRNKCQNSCRVTHIPTGIVRKAETRSRESSYRDAMEALKSALEDLERSQGHQRENDTRKSQVGSGMRGDKRRTYRFQEDIVRDHLTGKQASCNAVLRGGFDKLWS